MAINLYRGKEKIAVLHSVDEIEGALLSACEGAEEKQLRVELGDGLYSLSRPLVLDAEQEPTLADARITLCAKEGETPVVTSLSPIDTGLFERVGEGVYAATLPADENGKHPVFRTLYKGEKRVPIAYGEESIHPFGFVNHYGGYREEEYLECNGGLYVEYEVAEKLASSPYAALTEMMMRIEWEFIIAHVEGVDLSDTVEHEGKKYALVKIKKEHLYSIYRRTNPCIGIKNRPLSFGNNPVYLKENTCTYDYRTGRLYLCLPKGERIEDVRLSFARLENLITLRSLRGATLRGLTLTGVDSFYVVENGYHSGQANNEKCAGKLEHAALYVSDMTDFTVEDCHVHDVGCNGILMKNRSERITVRGNRFTRVSMAALAVGNTTVAWEDPKNRSLSVTIEDNYLCHIGYEYPTAVAIYLTQVDGLRLSHNTVDRTAYSAVSVGWMIPNEKDSINIRNAEISYNRITESMCVLHDGAAIYVVGHNAMHDVAERFNLMFGNYCERAVEERGRQGYYLDGSSSNWEVHDNVSIGDSLPLFMQFNVPSQYNWHNRAWAIYATKPIDPKNHVEERDVLVGECYSAQSKESLFEKYPRAKEIYEASGCRIPHKK